MPSSNLHNFGGCIKCMHEVISYSKYIDFCMNPLCTVSLSLTIIINFFGWNLTYLGKIFQTSYLTHFLKLTTISWQFSPLLRNHQRISVGYCVSLSVFLCMSIWDRWMTGLWWNYDVIDWNECYNALKIRWGPFVSSVSDHRKNSEDRATPHKQCPPRPCLSSLRSIQWQCCILATFMFVCLKLHVIFLSIIRFIQELHYAKNPCTGI